MDESTKPTMKEFAYAVAVAIWKNNDLHNINGIEYYEHDIAKMIEDAMIEVYGKDS